MFTAQDVKELREMTGCGMMDCKKALTETDGDKEKAVELLREKGLAKGQRRRCVRSINHLEQEAERVDESGSVRGR